MCILKSYLALYCYVPEKNGLKWTCFLLLLFAHHYSFVPWPFFKIASLRPAFTITRFGLLQATEKTALPTLMWLTFQIVNTYKALFERKVTLYKGKNPRTEWKTWVDRGTWSDRDEISQAQATENSPEQKTNKQNNQIQINCNDHRD